MSQNKTLFEINLSSLSTLLVVLFIGLKLGNVITWSWWWVLSPLWLPWVLFALAFLIIKIMAYLLIGHDKRYNKWYK